MPVDWTEFEAAEPATTNWSDFEPVSIEEQKKALGEQMKATRRERFIGEQVQSAIGAAKDIASVAAIPATPILKLPRSEGSGVTSGLLNLGAGAVEGASAPAYWLIPGSKPLQALASGQLLGGLPESVPNAIRTIRNPNATMAEKVQAGGTPVLEAGFGGLLARSPGEAPIDLRETVTGRDLNLPQGASPPPPERIAKPVVPETPPEPRLSAAEEARAKGANTIQKVLDLFPSLEGNHSKARVIRDAAFPKTAETGVLKSGSEISAVPETPIITEVAKEGPPSVVAGEAPPSAVREIALEEQKNAGWDPKWPFVPADFYNKTFRDAIESDPSLGESTKTKMFSAAEKLLGGKIEREKGAPSGESGVPPPTAPATVAAKEGAVPAAPSEPAMAEPTPTTPPEQLGSVTHPVTEGAKPVGMGGAVAEEFEPVSKTTTSIKNAVVDKERVMRGLPPAIQPIRRAFGEVWDRAMAMIDHDPQVIDNLLDSLRNKPRALNDTENALLLHRQVDLQNEYGKATRDLAQAFDDGREDAVATEKIRVARLSDQLQDLYDIGKKVGTETGRGLAARKMLANEDFTLAKMEMDIRGAKGGKPLTDAERSQMQELHNKILATQKAYDDYKAATDARIAELENQSVFTDLVKKSVTPRTKTAATPEALKEASIAGIKKKLAENDQANITWDVQKLAKAFIQSGITEREALIDAVHQVLATEIPGLTRRETMDAISGYGDYRQLSKDEITVKLRGMKGEMQQLAKLEDMARGEPPLKTGVERRTPTDAERRLIKEVNDAKLKFQVPVSDPSVQLKSALDTLKTTLSNRIKDYQDRIAKGDYAARPKRSVTLDSEAIRLKAANERVKKQFQRGVALERLKNATKIERAGNWIVKWRRGFILSGPVTLAKLTSAAVQRSLITPVEELLGSAIGKAIPSVASRTQREGGINVKAESKAITEGLTQGMRDSWQTLKTGQSDLDVLYGKAALLPPSAIDFFGHVHGALKAPVKRAEFARSFEKRSQAVIDAGGDITDPLVQSALVVAAYKDANRAIFLQDNRVVSAYQMALMRLEQKDKVSGNVPLAGKAAATTSRILLPIVKVPINIVAETLQNATGLITGSARLGRAFYKGIENLKPEEADLIMRSLKKGSLGAAVMLLGFFNPEVIGGYYQPGEKRKPGDVKVGSVRVYGLNIPSFLLHNPLLETMQIGATVRRVSESKLRKKDVDQQGVTAGALAGARGLAEQVPFVRETEAVSHLLDPRQSDTFWFDLAKSLIVPQAVQSVATFTDKDIYGNPIKRKPRNTVEAIEAGIPVLRQTVPQNIKK